MNVKEITEKIFEDFCLSEFTEEKGERFKLEVEALLTEAFKEAERHAQHCVSCHEDHAEGYAPSDECTPYCCCEGMRAEDARVKKAVAQEREECAKVAEDKQRTEALLFGPANCCSQSARTIAGRIKARLSKGTK